jgi:hypothetical protein
MIGISGAAIAVSADDSMSGMKNMPQTAAEHTAMADSYTKKAAEYRQDAQFHRQMLADYKKGVAVATKSPVENSWIAKERIHCEKYIKDAEQLATDDDQFAKFHTMRAKEVQS